jgi:arylsulfatase
MVTTIKGGSIAARSALAMGCCLLVTTLSAATNVAEAGKEGLWQHVASATPPKDAPNIVLILLDDVGFGASSTFGGPIETPALERLAARGLRYNRFHVPSVCSATRAALLSGRNDHKVGFGSIMELPRPDPGYTTVWPKDAVSLAEVLRRNGYHTAAIGKWHNTPKAEVSDAGPFTRWPTGLGFDYFFGFLGGLQDPWKPQFYENTHPFKFGDAGKSGLHQTTAIADGAIRWLDKHRAEDGAKPYFLYVATGATHAAHHAPQEWIDRFPGRFHQGYEQLREETLARQKRLGLVPQNTKLTAWPDQIPRWVSLSPDMQRLLIGQMEVYAGYLAHTDYEIGRILSAIERGADADNTLIIYIVGDNGGSSEGGPTGKEVHDRERPLAERLELADALGGPQPEVSYNEYASGWGLAMNTPFQWSKQVASHLGGTRVPLVMAWPRRIKDTGAIRSQFGHVTDIAATIYDLRGLEVPKNVDGLRQQPLDGISLAYSIAQPSAQSRRKEQIFEQYGNRAIYKDGWIASARHSIPWEWGGTRNFDADRWELYDLDRDFSQSTDIADEFPQKLKELKLLFDREAKESNIYPLGNLSDKN